MRKGPEIIRFRFINHEIFLRNYVICLTQWLHCTSVISLSIIWKTCMLMCIPTLSVYHWAESLSQIYRPNFQWKWRKVFLNASQVVVGVVANRRQSAETFCSPSSAHKAVGMDCSSYQSSPQHWENNYLSVFSRYFLIVCTKTYSCSVIPGWEASWGNNSSASHHSSPPSALCSQTMRQLQLSHYHAEPVERWVFKKTS